MRDRMLHQPTMQIRRRSNPIFRPRIGSMQDRSAELELFTAKKRKAHFVKAAQCDDNEVKSSSCFAAGGKKLPLFGSR
ncbi:hypothetical protein Zmor_019690 [Zophobas morio]|uniref:Uncharacterized protein n=1 Tax=Zophobas morio TaxID=2755281 RepID=A0AA38I592_9CUCU|nr:hypothetical protein Zmor_019689 [Zophobas morio]KAJ3647833.1 hypothetical protein Zmor_019690 [Zophobas morio]